MDEAVICPGCGCAQGTKPQAIASDASSIGWAILGFCVPIVGLILYLIWKDDTPLKAKSVGTGALASVIVSVVLSIVAIIIYAAVVGILIGSIV